LVSHSFPTRRSSDLIVIGKRNNKWNDDLTDKPELIKPYKKIGDKVAKSRQYRQAVRKVKVVCIGCKNTFNVDDYLLPESVMGDRASYRCKKCTGA
jgi:hypothetical protein